MLERIELSEVELESADLSQEPSPLDVLAPTGDVEADCVAEMEIIESEFAARKRIEAQRLKKGTDSEYWCCLCFQDREQADAFAAALRQPGAKYLDGVKAARLLGIELPDSPVPFGRARIDPKWAKMAMEV